MPARRLLCVAALLLAGTPAFGQIIWNFTYTDGNIQSGGIGFADPTVASGQTLSNGQLRRNSMVAAADYLSRYLDGRGTINANLNASLNENTGVLASFGPNQLIGANGTYQNGGMYQAARTNTRPFAGSDGAGQFNFFHGWNYEGQVGGPVGGRYDMVTVGIHEIMHGLGFLSFASETGAGLGGAAVGSPSIYSGMNRWLQRGNGAFNATSALFNVDITSSGYGSFVGDPQTFKNGNNASTGLFFGGEFAREVNGGAPIPMYAPATFSSGSSVSHVNDSNAVMNPSVSANTIKRFRPYEVAMMMDAGWNVYQWNDATGGTGSWSTGTANVTQSRWRSDSGIVFVSGTNYNRNSAQNPAPVLPVYGQVTSNIVLNFRNTSGTAYISTNDIGSVRLSRLTFSSTNAAGGITIASSLAANTLNFGQNLDGTPSVLVPKIIQNGVAPAIVTSGIQVNTIATQNVDGVSFAGHSGVTVEGTGSGLVTLSGAITGDGGITKNSSTFNLVLGGANTYTGTTTVNAGAVYVNGTLSSTTNGVTVAGGTLGGTGGTVSRAITVNSGGTIEGGTTSTIGTLNVRNTVTVNGGGNLRAELGSGGSSDEIDLTGGSHTLDLKNTSKIQLQASGFTRTSTTYTLADLNGTTTSLLQIDGVGQTAGNLITTFDSTGGNAGTLTNHSGDIDLVLTGFSLTSGDKFVLRRDLTTGDLILQFTPVPEPAGVLLLCGLGVAGVAGWRRWRASRAA